jgi:3-isopropylmalate dehydrogenase
MAKEYNISVIPGDGTGPEVVAEGLKILQIVADKCDFRFNYNHYNLGGEHYKATGEILPDSVIELLAKSDAIYLGAIGHPDVKPGIL